MTLVHFHAQCCPAPVAFRSAKGSTFAERKTTYDTMQKPICAVILLGFLLLAPLLTAPAEGQTNKEAKIAAASKEAGEVFGLTKVHRFHLELSAREWERMQAVVGGMRFPGMLAPPATPPPPPPFGKGGSDGGTPGEEPLERHKGGSFGMEFPWARAEMTAEGRTYKNLGLRYKGGGSYMVSTGKLRRNLKVDFDRHEADQRFQGLKTLNLNAGAMDPTRLREALAFAFYRAAGVAAPRTAFAEVTLTVPGKYDREVLGLYTVIEQVDSSFLRDRFKNANGFLMKPEVGPGGLRSPFAHLGDDWERYRAMSGAKREPSKKEAQRVIGFSRLIHQADDEQFRKGIDSYLDTEQFLRFLAATALLANLDSVFLGHNAYIYLDPATNKFVFIPWDVDLAFGGFFLFGPPEQQADLSLTHPYAGENKLVERLLAIKDISERYQKLLKDLAVTCFAKEKMLKDIDMVEQATKDILAREAKAAEARKEGPGGFPFGPGVAGGKPDLRTFVEKRGVSVAAQLSGKSKGFTPAMGFGPGGRPGGFGPGMFLAMPALQGADSNGDKKVSLDEARAAVKRLFQECDKEKKGTLNEKSLVDGIERLLPRPPGFGGPGGPPGAPPGAAGNSPGAPGGGPGGGPGPGFARFNPAARIASAVIRVADTNQDKQLTIDELLAAAEKLFKEWDADRSGLLDDKKISEGLNRLIGPPPGFGPPPGGPPPGETKKGGGV